ncbi:DUF885 domain-containing protein [Gluconacetobacter diazotrophicus]|uniref:DUF885 domain-containing protein n=1 Tax=Gluconacetobacter diazotrophicus TaxID=33996 RepID=UPI0002F6ECD9|nr:DUF885 family protein [Gluconacetobacter diazotrophicus]
MKRLLLASIALFPGLAHAAEDRNASFQALLAQQWEWQLRESPELATTIGDDRYNDRWSDMSLAHVAVQDRALKDFQTRFTAFGTAGLSEQNRLSRQMMLQQLAIDREAIRLKIYEMPIDQINGVPLQLAGFVSSIPFDSVRHYQDYIARLHAIPAVLQAVVDSARAGMADHLMPPRFLLEKAIPQLRGIASPAGTDNVFGQPALHFPATIPADQQAALRAQIIAAVDREVRPAFEKTADFVEKDYAPHGRAQDGIWALPDGTARYRFAIRQQTTSTMTPAAIHALGLAEVARIEKQMTDVAHRLGFADLAALRASVQTDHKLFATSREEILDRYRTYIAGMRPELPRLFGTLPKADVKVQAVETYREAEAPDAEYHQGTPDGSRPGIVFVNTGDFAHRDLYTIEDTAYHEGIPGHHLQIALAQTLPLPPFRQQGSYNSYVEGWALYAERLAKDYGFYKDAYNEYGWLNGELLRADRLVLDTGVHYLHWTRPQMIAFFRAHPSESEPGMQAETDRYIAWPGQALGYKLGQLEILDLRARAQKALGPKFDIRAFHDEILGGGALPLDMLDQRVTQWIAAQRAALKPS